MVGKHQSRPLTDCEARKIWIFPDFLAFLSVRPGCYYIAPVKSIGQAWWDHPSGSKHVSSEFRNQVVFGICEKHHKSCTLYCLCSVRSAKNAFISILQRFSAWRWFISYRKIVSLLQCNVIPLFSFSIIIV